jgi:hypothetical protein
VASPLQVQGGAGLRAVWHRGRDDPVREVYGVGLTTEHIIMTVIFIAIILLIIILVKP